MGNAQSHGHHHNRLSKPKTNTNSPALQAVKADSPISVSSRYADLSAKGRQQIRTQLLSPVDTDFGSGASSNGYDDIGELASHVQRRLSTLSRSNSLSCFGGNGRNSITKLSSLPGSKLSLVTDPQVVDLETAVKLLENVKKNTSPEDLVALHQALQPSASPVPEHGLNPKSSITNRSSSSLTRRRSLVATPGLATRHSPNEGNRKKWNSWQTPELNPQEQAKWTVDKMGTSPLTRLAALDLHDGRESPTPRAQTPGDMDYSHLGSLRLGSLIVTNGAPSPSPSAKMSKQRSNPHFAQEDYFTVSEDYSSPIMMKPTRKRGHGRSKSSLNPTTPPLYRNLHVSDQERRAKTTSRYDSSLKDGVKNLSHLRDEIEVEPTKIRLRVMNQSIDSTDNLAKEYQAEIPNSPFDTSFNTAKHYHADEYDEGFASDDAKSFRNEAFRILDGTIFSEPEAASASARPTPHPIPAVEPSTEHQKKQKPSKRPIPKKADSGYSSGGSFRRVHGEAAQEGTIPTLSKKPSIVADMLKSGNGSDSDDAISLYTFEQMLQLPISKPLPPLPNDENVVSRPVSLQIPEPRISESSNPRTFLSPQTPVSVVSQFSIDSKSSTMQKRLQKRRPSHQELPIVQSCDPIPEGSIPPPGENVRSKFVRRLSETPAMECLTQTYPSIDHVNADESPVDVPIVPIEFPSPSAPSAPEIKGDSLIESDRPPTPPLHGIRRSLSLFRSKSMTGKKKETKSEDESAAPNVVNLGTIASALGRSPYDIAMSNVPKKTVTSPTHPYQLGDALPRAKAMLDSQTAAEFARLRSKDRALLRPQMPQRPQSYHDGYLGAGVADVIKPRPHSFYNELPPMPTVELSKQTVQAPVDCVKDEDQIEENAAPSFRARTSGRGPVVSRLIEKYDQYGQKIPQQNQDWEPHARLWSQRRKSIGEGLRQRAEDPHGERAASQAPEVFACGRYSGGLEYGYEHGYGVGGSAGTRQLHSYASRKSIPFRNQYGVDLSDVPVFLQRA